MSDDTRMVRYHAMHSVLATTFLVPQGSRVRRGSSARPNHYACIVNRCDPRQTNQITLLTSERGLLRAPPDKFWAFAACLSGTVRHSKPLDAKSAGLAMHDGHARLLEGLVTSFSLVADSRQFVHRHVRTPGVGKAKSAIVWY